MKENKIGRTVYVVEQEKPNNAFLNTTKQWLEFETKGISHRDKQTLLTKLLECEEQLINERNKTIERAKSVSESKKLNFNEIDSRICKVYKQKLEVNELKFCKSAMLIGDVEWNKENTEMLEALMVKIIELYKNIPKADEEENDI